MSHPACKPPPPPALCTKAKVAKGGGGGGGGVFCGTLRYLNLLAKKERIYY